MLNFENISDRAIAAVSSIAFSVVFFAVAIAPANQGALLPAMMA